MPVGNSFHTSNSSGKDFDPNPNKLCANCHEVWIDYDHDGVVEKGLDLALQTTWDEYTEYKTLGGRETCVSCHMPAVANLTRAADGAQIPGQQLATAPPRQIHDHSFPGVDFALDTASQQQSTEAARTALLKSAAYFQIDRNSVGFDGNGLGFDVFIANTGTGHDLPSGFAFARQMWIEITVTDASQNTLFTSGVITNPTDDLCDGDSLFEFGNPMKRFFQGCPRVDDELVTFQQKLVDLAGFQVDGSDPFDPAGLTKAVQIGNETWLQYLHGGVVARQRTFDGTLVANLKPFQEEEFHYDVPTGNGGTDGLHIRARLLWRQLPPYFLRALAGAQPSNEVPQLSPLIGNLETIEMASDGNRSLTTDAERVHRCRHQVQRREVPPWRLRCADSSFAALLGCNQSGSAQASPGGDASSPQVDAGTPIDASADASPVCFTNPRTYLETINACTDAQAIDKTDDLSTMNLADGGLRPLP